MMAFAMVYANDTFNPKIRKLHYRLIKILTTRLEKILHRHCAHVTIKDIDLAYKNITFGKHGVYVWADPAHP